MNGRSLMIENYLLEELIAFAKFGTLAATAKHLLVTQPTVTRGMQKLEEELNVQIFDRQPNRITLTKTGLLAAKEAQKVLDQNQYFIETIQKFDYSQRVIHLGSVAPGPMIVLNSLNLASNVQLENQFISPQEVSVELLNNNFSMIITNQEIQTEQLESRYIGTEKLSVNLDKFTYLANKNTVTFQDLKNISFIVLTDIGIWKDIIQTHIPNAKFLYQDQVDAFTEITNYSNFPYFNTNLSLLAPHNQNPNDDRVQIPISDETAQVDFYATYQKSRKNIVTPVIKQMVQAWI